MMTLKAKSDRFGILTSWTVRIDGVRVGTIEAPTLNGGGYRATAIKPTDSWFTAYQGEFESRQAAADACRNYKWEA